MKSIGECLAWGTTQLSLSDITDARFEASLLLTHVLQCDRAALMTWPEKVLASVEQSTYESLIQRRAQGEPIAYLLGHRGFWTSDFKVTADTLIPRVETELLIEQVLAHCPLTPLIVLDVGTGSGIIACTLAKERPYWQLVATDISKKAIDVARGNAQQLQLSNIEWRETSWCEGLPSHHFDVMVSNPPYIAETDPHVRQGDLRFEPRSALVSGPTGLEAYITLIPMAKRVLKPGGLLAFEHGYEQAEAVQALMRAQGFTGITTFADLSHHPRVTLGKI